MIALIVVALGAVIAAVGTGTLAARSTRRPRVYFVAWAVALFGFAIGLGATTLGYLAGYDSLMFRAMELGTQLIAPLALCVALVEVAGRSLAARFGMRLAVSGIAIIAVVILGTDPINPNVTFNTKWPDPAIFYQIAPLTVLGFLTLFTAVTAVVSLAIMMVRSSREQVPRDEGRPGMLVALGALAVALPGLAWLLDKSVGIALPLPEKDIFAASCTLAAFLVWYAARIAGNRDLGQAPFEASASRHSDENWDAAGRALRPYETGEFDEFAPAERLGGRRAGAGYDPRDPNGGYAGQRYEDGDSEFQYPGLAALVDGQADRADDPALYGETGLGESGPYSDGNGYPATGQYAVPERLGDDSDQFGRQDRFGGEPGHLDGAGRYPADQRYLDRRDDDPHGQLFGQITIYTLNEGRAKDFDRLTEWVVAQVQAEEPGTLVYIVHAVPTAPMQRILYEVYRDRTAHDEHLRRGYVMTYEAEQRPLVLATNVIELGLQQAKVSPLPSMSAISDILSESGIDLTGVTRSSQSGNQPRSRGYHRSSPSGRLQRFGPDFEPDLGDDLRPDFGRQDQPDDLGRSRTTDDEFGQPEYRRPYSGWADMRGEDSRYS